MRLRLKLSPQFINLPISYLHLRMFFRIMEYLAEEARIASKVQTSILYIYLSDPTEEDRLTIRPVIIGCFDVEA